jgi:hypothetical protein
MCCEDVESDLLVVIGVVWYLGVLGRTNECLAGTVGALKCGYLAIRKAALKGMIDRGATGANSGD